MVVGTRTILWLVAFICMVGLSLGIPLRAAAHRSGCHTLHTCPSDAKTYVCGDLGFACDGSTSIDAIAPKNINVPLVIEVAFKTTFGRVPTVAESTFWKQRWRGDKDGLRKLRSAMAWHKEHNSFGPKVSVSTERGRLISSINRIFASVYDRRLPTPSESRYWISRVNDKPTEEALRGAMSYHKAKNIQR